MVARLLSQQTNLCAGYLGGHPRGTPSGGSSRHIPNSSSEPCGSREKLTRCNMFIARLPSRPGVPTHHLLLTPWVVAFLKDQGNATETIVLILSPSLGRGPSFPNMLRDSPQLWKKSHLPQLCSRRWWLWPSADIGPRDTRRQGQLSRKPKLCLELRANQMPSHSPAEGKPGLRLGL